MDSSITIQSITLTIIRCTKSPSDLLSRHGENMSKSTDGHYVVLSINRDLPNIK